MYAVFLIALHRGCVDSQLMLFGGVQDNQGLTVLSLVIVGLYLAILVILTVVIRL